MTQEDKDGEEGEYYDEEEEDEDEQEEGEQKKKPPAKKQEGLQTIIRNNMRVDTTGTEELDEAE